MKKSYATKGRTTIAIDPKLATRMDKVLKDSGKKASQYARDVINKDLEEKELKQTVDSWKKLTDTDQYHEIRKLREDNKDLKKITTDLEERISDLEAVKKYYGEEYAEDEKFASMSFEELQEYAEKVKHDMLEVKNSELEEVWKKLDEVVNRNVGRFTKEQKKELEKEVKKSIDERIKKRKKLFKK